MDECKIRVGDVVAERIFAEEEGERVRNRVVFCRFCDWPGAMGDFEFVECR